MGFDDKGKEGAAPDAPETHHEGSGDERGTALSRHMSEGSIPAPTEDEEEDVERKIDLGPQCTLKEQLEKDKDDESLRRWKEQLLGSVDINAVGESLEPEVKILSLAIKAAGREDIVLPIPESGNPEGLWFTLKEGSRYSLMFTFQVSHNIVSGLKYTNTVWKTGLKVDSTKEMIGTFSPQAEPYTHEMPEETTPSGLFARGTYSARSKEYSVRATSGSDKHYFIGRFVSGLPDFSKKKSAENKWALQKEGLQSRQVTDALREKYKNKPWLLEDETGQSQFQGHLEGAQSATYYLLMMERKEFVAIPAGSWYNFNKVAQYKQLTLEEAEEKMKNRKKTADGYERWMMKAANNGPAAFGERGRFDEKESIAGGRGKSSKKTDDDEGHVSDKGEEDEDGEVGRRSRLGLNKKGGDDDDEGPRGGDLDLDDDDIEKGDDWEHEEIFTDDDEAVGNNPEEREDLASEVPAPPEIKQDDEDEDEENEEGGGLSKSGKELKKLLRTSSLNESDAEDDDYDDDVDDEAGLPPVIVSKQKGAPKEEPTDNSPSKPAITGTVRGTVSTSKPSKGKRKFNEETKSTNGAPPKKVKIENEPKSTVKDENGSASKNNAPAKGVPPAPSSKGGSSPIVSGPVSEEEIRAVLMQKTPLTTQDLVAKFRARLRSPEDKKAFADILKRISKIQKTNTSSYVILRDR